MRVSHYLNIIENYYAIKLNKKLEKTFMQQNRATQPPKQSHFYS